MADIDPCRPDRSLADVLAYFPAAPDNQGSQKVPEQFLVIVRCMDEAQQIKILRMLQKQGYKAEAKTT